MDWIFVTFFFLFPFSKGETDGRLGMIGTSSVMEYAANCWAACLQRGATAWDFGGVEGLVYSSLPMPLSLLLLLPRTLGIPRATKGQDRPTDRAGVLAVRQEF